MTQWEFNWTNTWDEVWGENFIARWRELMQGAADAHVFYEPDIVRAWYKTYNNLRDIEPRFLIATCGKDYKIFLPLICDKGGWKDGWQNVIYSAGQLEFDYHDPIASKDLSDDLKSSFWLALKEELVASDDRIDVVEIPRIRDIWKREDNSLLKPVAKAPYIDLKGFNTFEDFSKGLHSKMRRDIGRQKRRMNELGSLELKHIRDINKALEILPTLEKVRKEKWVVANRTKDFYRNLVILGLKSGIVQLSVLESDGKAICWHLGFLYKGKYYNYIMVFNPEMAAFSPGKIHLAMIIEEAIKLKLDIFDFMLGVEDYKFQWANGSVDLYEYEWKVAGVGAGIRHNIRKTLQSVAAIKSRMST